MEPLLTSLVGGVKFTGSNIQKSPLHLVLYLSHKNYAQILEQQQELAAKKSKLASSSSSCTPAALPATQLPPSAFLHYAKAAAIDSSDPALMLKLGDLALQKEGWFSIARNVYYCGYMGGGNSCEYVSLNFNRTTGAPLFTKSASSSSSSTSSLPIGPTRKSCLYGLIEALWELGEFTDCLFYINQALLHDPHWTKSQQGIRCRWIQHSIIKLHLAGRHSLTS